ncbi:unnamed protein product [Amoebophrya sp. A25]|nr:unnamed protein product [Amoebophrya sp. A25]|eukprot:GSA25T00024721001.1
MEDAEGGHSKAPAEEVRRRKRTDEEKEVMRHQMKMHGMLASKGRVLNPTAQLGNRGDSRLRTSTVGQSARSSAASSSRGPGSAATQNSYDLPPREDLFVGAGPQAGGKTPGGSATIDDDEESVVSQVSEGSNKLLYAPRGAPSEPLPWMKKSPVRACGDSKSDDVSGAKKASASGTAKQSRSSSSKSYSNKVFPSSGPGAFTITDEQISGVTSETSTVGKPSNSAAARDRRSASSKWQTGAVSSESTTPTRVAAPVDSTRTPTVGAVAGATTPSLEVVSVSSSASTSPLRASAGSSATRVSGKQDTTPRTTASKESLRLGSKRGVFDIVGGSATASTIAEKPSTSSSPRRKYTRRDFETEFRLNFGKIFSERERRQKRHKRKEQIQSMIELARHCRSPSKVRSPSKDQLSRRGSGVSSVYSGISDDVSTLSRRIEELNEEDDIYTISNGGSGTPLWSTPSGSPRDDGVATSSVQQSTSKDPGERRNASYFGRLMSRLFGWGRSGKDSSTSQRAPKPRPVQVKYINDDDDVPDRSPLRAPSERHTFQEPLPPATGAVLQAMRQPQSSAKARHTNAQGLRDLDNMFK